MKRFWDFVDKRKIVRRAGYFALWTLVFLAFNWSLGYADLSLMMERSGVETAAVIAAIWAPLSMLAGHVFKVYANGRSNESDAGAS